jgi:hypothetical protein
MDTVGIAKMARIRESPVNSVLITTDISPIQRNLKPDSKASREQLVERVKANMRPTSTSRT